MTGRRLALRLDEVETARVLLDLVGCRRRRPEQWRTSRLWPMGLSGSTTVILESP
jgi:hypothetical protein